MSAFAKKIYVFCPLLLILSFLFDQFTKHLASEKLTSKSVRLIPGVLKLTYLKNRGVGFGMLQNRLYVILAVNVVILGLLVYFFIHLPKEKRFFPVFLLVTLVISGALGNLSDRLRLGYVIDFIYIELIDFPVFNVADMYVSFSVVIFAVLSLFHYKTEEWNAMFTRKSSVNTAQEDAPHEDQI